MSKWRWDWKPSKFQQMRLDKDKETDFAFRPGAHLQYQNIGQQSQANLLGQLGGLAGIGNIFGVRK